MHKRNLQKNGAGIGWSTIKDTFAEKLQLQMSVPHQSMCNFKACGTSLSDSQAKYKEKVPDRSDSTKMLEQHAVPS